VNGRDIRLDGARGGVEELEHRRILLDRRIGREVLEVVAGAERVALAAEEHHAHGVILLRLAQRLRGR
jgi:hypothetical protein